jgi:hypothetical protein
LLFFVFTYITLAFDPFKWGLVHSSRFTWEKFAEVKPGEQINTVISRLGEPVRPAEDLSVLTEDPRDPCVKGSCKKYLFAGADWGSTFREAIVIVDQRGTVVHAEARQE